MASTSTETVTETESLEMISEETLLAVPKRKLVDPDGKELPDPKRSRALPEDDVKGNAIKLVMHWHEFLIRVFQIINITQIDDVADITSICWTIHSKLRQTANGIGSMITKITLDHEFQFKEIKIKWRQLEGPMKELAAMYGFNYGSNEASKAKTGTLGALLCLFTSYRPKFNEIRTGTGKITLKKVNNETHDIPIEAFGLSSRHSILMSGCTFNPVLQSSMKQSLGPMTIAINLAMQVYRTYQKAWKSAFINAFKLYPNVHEIAEILAGNKHHNNALMGIIADLALFATTRASNKASFPLALVLTVARTNSSYFTFFNGAMPNTKILDSMLPTTLKHLDFSGAGAYNFWKQASELTYDARRGLNMTARTIREAVFHAVWGSQKEDLGLLHFLTGHTFQNRREMGTQFQERGSGPDIQFSLVKFTKITKMANATQTDFVSGGKGQISRAPTFSGRCVQRVNLDDDLFKILLSDQDTNTAYINEPGRILSSLAKLKESMAKRVGKDGVIRFGTTDYYGYSPDRIGYGNIILEIPELSNRYFFGQDN